MDAARLCRALQRAFSERAEATMALPTSPVLNEMGIAFGAAAAALEADEVERLTMIGGQPRELAESKPDA